ncbi:MAG: cation-translocating P-type ATPase [Lentisphaerae bacterium]|jgi:heavy metal translocating P-type ATPase|nr:cation-translocating P-type ATPase [Lentisphaerota bacterium]MBT5612258.1 cation-translocating P-type ATPase [Lentisphaerota bacterium]MBT7060764.1 cation-translocating P-type ATPase [Lentisphaerota bacterium]MBT7845237.1 cation-translocating P-type ATPase [Lentisphaerota bacterium]
MSDNQATDTSDRQELMVLSIVPAAVAALTLASWALAHWEIGPLFVNVGLALVATLFGGFTRFIAGFKDLFNRKITVNVFVVVALIATLAISEFRPAAVIVFIMAAAGALETYTMDKTRRSIRDLLDFAPKTATVRRDGEEVTVAVDDLQLGDRVVVRPGERIAVDGVVVAGQSSVNQAPITGESMPVEKAVGIAVFSGTLNESGRLEIRTEKVGEGTTLARIVYLVQEAQGTRAPIQNLADRFTTWFLPTVVVLAVLAFFVAGDIKAAVSVLLVACPCAFAIATPTAVTAGVSNLARRAVLVKGGIFLELGHRIDHLLVDKTGTFTFGRPKLADVVSLNGCIADDVLRLACTAEKYSEHPLARSILAAGKERGISIPEPENFTTATGMGVMAQWEGATIRVGKSAFLRDAGLGITPETEDAVAAQSELGRTAVLVARDNEVVGLLSVADEVRPEIPGTIRALKALGVKQITMLTGDHPKVAAAVAEAIGVDDYQAELLPEQKQAFVKRCQAEGQVIGMIGDGINDAPALALAEVGIAMGAAGTDVAIETADVTLMNDDISGVADFMWMSAKVMRRIKWNIFFSLIYNIVGLTLSIVGLMTPIIAVIFQEAGCVTVVFSSTLLLWAKGRPVRA